MPGAAVDGMVHQQRKGATNLGCHEGLRTAGRSTKRSGFIRPPRPACDHSGRMDG